MATIVAIGGGEIGRPGHSIETMELDTEVVRLADRRRPRVVFLPTASVDDSMAHALIRHELFSPLPDNCDPGPPLPSHSPWTWSVGGFEGGPRCGRAESPVQAAIAVDELLVAAGAAPFERTQS